MIAGGRFPDPLVEGARSVLRQYGYRHLEEGRSRDDWAEMWPLLRSDFAQGAGPAVPQYDALPVAIGEAAREYMRRRLIADHLLDACQEAHAALFRDGIDSARVEAYSAAREAYEHSVEDFGAAGEIVEGLLHGHAAG
ncbi:MAG: hypothetical protein GY791_05510 [Alphaproteobacteria bacterium]|nr:hypothetical protein [Alphaproteobacteria bacterium]